MHYFVVALNLVFLAWTWLRETPEFWLNSGGYPLWLREITPPLYYPCLGMMITLTAVLLIPGSRPRGATGWVCCVVAVFLLWLSMLVMVANNIQNLWEGRPLHDHSV